MRIHNKSGKPMNIVVSENKLIEKCIQLENEMPDFLKDYFIFIKNSVSRDAVPFPMEMASIL